MSLKRLLLDTVPNNIQQEPPFITLLDHIKEHNIESKEHLEKFISQQIDIVDKATQLDMLREFDNLTTNFL